MITVTKMRFIVHRRMSGHRVTVTACEAVGGVLSFGRVTADGEVVSGLAIDPELVMPLSFDARLFSLCFNND